jgi:3-phenylpropionate/trans-cinnamate dioxygenase ferredoxin reductase subunit
LQTIGLSTGHEKAIVRGNPKTPPFSIIYLKHDKVIALDCVNAVKDYVQGRKLIEMCATVNIDDLINTDIPLKEVLQLTTTGE